MYRKNIGVIPSFIIVLTGIVDAITTVIGTLYYGATELNPLLSGLVSTNIPAFLVLKIVASVLIGATYILVKRIMNQTENKNSKSFKFGNMFMKITYTSLIGFLIIVTINNLLILLR